MMQITMDVQFYVTVATKLHTRHYRVEIEKRNAGTHTRTKPSVLTKVRENCLNEQNERTERQIGYTKFAK